MTRDAIIVCLIAVLAPLCIREIRDYIDEKRRKKERQERRENNDDATKL